MTAQTRHSPTLADVLNVLVSNAAAALYTSLPARVESYNASERSVDVKPMIPQAYLDEAGTRVLEELPVITQVPVCFPGAGDHETTFPIGKGDTLLVCFSHSAIEAWLTTGRIVDPGDDRHQDLSDAFAVLGLRPFKDVEAASEDATVVRGDEVRLGSKDASESAIKGDARDTAEQTFLTALDTFAAATLAPAPAKAAFSTAVTTFKAAVSAALSSKVKVE